MYRGEVWWATFDHGVGGEIRKTRPVIIVSNDAANKALNRVQLVPLTRNVSRLYPSEAYVMLGDLQCKAMADQVVTASKSRLLRRMGLVGAEDMKSVERALEIQLGLG